MNEFPCNTVASPPTFANFHHPASPLYPILLLPHPFSTPGHYSSRVMFSNRAISITAPTTSFELSAVRAPRFFRSVIITENHPSSFFGSSVCHTQGSKLNIEVSSTQENIHTLTHLILCLPTLP